MLEGQHISCGDTPACPASAGRLLPEGEYAPPRPASGVEEANQGTQFPFELTMRPATQQASQVPHQRNRRS